MWINRGLMTVLLVIVYNGYPIGGKFGVSICLDHTLDTVSLMIHSHLDHFPNLACPRDGNYYCTRSGAIKTAKQIAVRRKRQSRMGHSGTSWSCLKLEKSTRLEQWNIARYFRRACIRNIFISKYKKSYVNFKVKANESEVWVEAIPTMFSKQTERVAVVHFALNFRGARVYDRDSLRKCCVADTRKADICR